MLNAESSTTRRKAMLVRHRAGIHRPRREANRVRSRACQPCPEAWIEQMKHIGICGLAIDEQYGGSPV